MNESRSFRERVARWLLGTARWETLTPSPSPSGRGEFAGVSVQVDDAPGWAELSRRPHERDWAEIQDLYDKGLEAYRKNPIAWRIIATTTNYVVGDRLAVTSPRASLQRFIVKFWNHPKNLMGLRLAELSDELARAGDLFPVLFRNPADGMSYIRFVTKDRIIRIESAENDWENELAYTERLENGDTRRWLAPAHPEAVEAEAVMLHYSVNRPMGALMGESDLAPMIPWLQRYSRMLEDRVRLHWAVRAFLWIVTVPSQKVREKREQYRTPPEAGSVIVKDESEAWQAMAPGLHGADAQHDLKAVRNMIDAGSGFPPHWRGEPSDANLATAQAMQAPTERHLARRQRYFVYMLQDLIYQAYQRAAELGKVRRLAETDYQELFVITAPEVSRSDNEALARAARDIAAALQSVGGQIGVNGSQAFQKLLLHTIFRFAGEPLDDLAVHSITAEARPPGQQAEEDGGKDVES